MTTEAARLEILAAAVALTEFTVPQLAAFTGSDAAEVRRVMDREIRNRALFVRAGHSGSAVLWRLDSAQLDSVISEIAAAEAASSTAEARIARAVVLIYETDEHGISPAFADHLTRVLTDSAESRSGPPEPQDVPLPADVSRGRGAALPDESPTGKGSPQ